MNPFSPSAKTFQSIKSYSTVSSFRQLTYFAMNWGFILGTAFLSEKYFHWQIYGVAIFLIAARQHALAILVHDAAHYRVAKNKFLNDFISNVFASFACLMGTHAYRLHHLKHHQFLNTEKDPDWARKIHLKDWQFPMPRSQLAKVLVKQIWTGGFDWVRLTSLMFKIHLKLDSSDRRNAEAKELFVFWVLVFASAKYFHLMSFLFLYWFIPLLTFFPLIQRFRSIAEHFAVTRDQVLDRTRNVEASMVERFLISPHSTNWHLVHHLYPSISHFNLKKAHETLCQEPVYLNAQHLNKGYFFPFRESVLADLVSVATKSEAVKKAA